jgi:hypothetical protein
MLKQAVYTGSSVGIATRLGLDDRGIEIRFSAGAIDFSLEYQEYPWK